MRVFVCYRRNDSLAITGRIDDHLRAEFGNAGVFRDLDSIPVGVDFAEHIAESIQACDIVVAVIGRQWLSDRPMAEADYVRLELETALERGVPIAPILVDGAELPKVEDLPASLHPLLRRQAMRVDSGNLFKSQINRMIAQIRASHVSPRKPGAAEPASTHVKPVDKSLDYFARKFDALSSAVEKVRELERTQTYLSDVRLGQISIDDSNAMDILGKMARHADSLHEVYLQHRPFVSPKRRDRIAALRSELHQIGSDVGKYLAYTKRPVKDPVEEERLLKEAIPAVQRMAVLAGETGAAIPTVLDEELEEVADFFNDLVPGIRAGG